MSRFVVLLLLAALCASCERTQPPPRQEREEREFAATVLHGVLAYPQSSVVNVSSGADAAQATFSTPAPMQTVATWYRQMLRLNGWELQSDAVMKDGSVAIFAQHGNRPLWITLKANTGGPGTTYTLIGTELPKDSVKDSLKVPG